MTTRRALLTAASLALLTGCGRNTVLEPLGEPDGRAAPTCRTPGDLVAFDAVSTGTLLYDETGAPTTMQSDPAFLARLEAWAADWAELSGLGAIRTVTSFGAYVDKCGSYHQVGRAFDISAIAHDRGEVSLRFDRWGPGSSTQLRDYWRLAASLHLHFSYTLAYPYDAAHHNHIHVDNAVSGDGLSTFNRRSGTQVQLVQYACRHVFGHDVEPTGDYDDQTRDAVRRVQSMADLTSPLATPEGWRGFLRAVARG